MAKHINFQLGWPSTSLFPNSQILGGASNILRSDEKTAAALIYGPDAGYEPLRESIALWLGKTYAPGEEEQITPSRVCISNGASHDLQNILAKFTEPGYTRKIWMIEPSYFLACPIFMDAGFENQLRGVPEDDEGLDIDFLRKGIEKVEADSRGLDAPKIKVGPRYPKIYKHVIYAVPTFANPSGKTMSLRRREALARLAREFDALIVTDDVYDVLRWPKSPDVDVSQLGRIPPRLVDIDRTLDGGPKDEWGNAVSNGSFSKIIAPGVRTGWAEGTPAFIHALSTVGATRSGGAPSHMTAAFIDEMMETGSFEAHIRDTLIPTYRARYYAMFEAIEESLLPLGFTVTTGTPYETSSTVQSNGRGPEIAAGGYFTYLTVPSGLSLSVPELAALAVDKYNVKFAYGEMMAVEGDPTSTERAQDGYGKGIRLCWAWHTSEDIIEGVERIATMFKEVKEGNT